MKLEEFRVYQLSMSIAEEIWNLVYNWDYFAKDTVGKQLIKAIDSVAANLSEGFGRFFYKEEKQFCYYSRGSLFETKTWLTKASNRKLISSEDFEKFVQQINDIGVRLNNYISSIGKKPLNDDE
ncbi:MAG: four helix bundle protein [Ignavibacteriales bacterium]|nr:MAG: four helix bundle protein [Ignavibacteriales bacterium]